MKQIFLTLVSTALIALSVPNAQAAKISVDFFYDALEPHGEWIETADYGYVWHPRDVDAEWRPYTVGNWAYTDAGWTWVSNEPFGWATYHYGRWVEIDQTGWVWMPDTTWGPAWVSWRRSKTHVGWAPLPPEARFEAKLGFHGWVDSYYDIGPTYYSFVQVRDFGAPRLRAVVLPARENITIINQTTNITNITYADNVVINQGPDYDVIVRESAQPVRRLKLERRTDIQADVRRAQLNAEVAGDSLRVAAPEIEATAGARARPKNVARKLERVEVDRGWRKAGDAAQLKQARAKVAAEGKTPEGLPPRPQLRGSDPARSADPASPATSTPDSPKPPAGTAAAGSEGENPRRGDAPGKTPPDQKNPGDTAQQPGDMKPGGTAEKPGAANPGATAQQPETQPKDATAEPPAAGRPGTTAQERRDQRREERPGVAKKKPGADELEPVAEGPASRRGGARPEAESPKREQPGVSNDAQSQADRPANESARPNRPQSRPEQAPRNRALEESSTRPKGQQPERSRPDAGRPERPNPPGERPERPEGRVPAEPQQRSPERARSEGADRSPETRPPEGQRPDRPGKGKDEKKEKPEGL